LSLINNKNICSELNGQVRLLLFTLKQQAAIRELAAGVDWQTIEKRVGRVKISFREQINFDENLWWLQYVVSRSRNSLKRT
jgi:hypothetical protein